MLFEELNIIQPIIRSLHEKGYKSPTLIQEKSIGVLLEGKDLLGTAQTGTGKTAAFAIPILQLLQKDSLQSKKHIVRALVLEPTRELAIQTKENFVAYSRHLRLRTTVVYGGVSKIPQQRAMRNGVDVLVATPGRLFDLMNQKVISLDEVKYFVLDEADLMLDMGFIDDVKKVITKIPENHQTMMFSATMPPAIKDLSESILKDPVRVAIHPETTTVENTDQFMYFVDKHDKKNLLIHLLKNEDIESALVFSRTKHGADKIAEDLVKAGFKADAIHGNKSQSARQLALRNFKTRKTKVLVATDIAARGIDVSELSHVINYDLPEVPETYVHRIGRTGRAGKSGVAFSFCDSEEVGFLRDIQRLIGQKIPVVTDQPYAVDLSMLAAPKKPAYNRFRGGHSHSSSGKRPFNHGGKPAANGFHKKYYNNKKRQG